MILIKIIYGPLIKICYDPYKNIGEKVSTPTRGAGSALISPNRTTRTTGCIVTKTMMIRSKMNDDDGDFLVNKQGFRCPLLSFLFTVH